MIVWAMALGLAMPVQAAQGQESLADRAARARKAAPAGSPASTAKVLTNEDLANAKGTVIVLPEPAAEPETGSTAETAAKPAKTEPTEEETRAQAGAALQKQIDGEVELIRAGQKAIAEWEAELNDITNYTFGTRRAALMQNIDEARKAMAASRTRRGGRASG
jgi:hypothetical protein